MIRDLIHVKEHFLTWPANAMTDYLSGTNNKFGEVLIQLKRFSGLWGDVGLRVVSRLAFRLGLFAKCLCLVDVPCLCTYPFTARGYSHRIAKL